MDMPVTWMISLTTWMRHWASQLPAVAVMVASPFFFALTRPLSSTVAVWVSELDQDTFLNVAFAGSTVACS